MGETTTATTAEAPEELPVTRGFKYVRRFDDAGGNKSEDPKVKADLTSEADGSVWELGVWRSVAGRIRLCENGFHMSSTPDQARSYVSGEVLALVEARGDSDTRDYEDKSAHREMRVIAWWPYSHVRAIQHDALHVDERAVKTAKNTAVQEARRVYDMAIRAAQDTYDKAVRPVRDAHAAAVLGPTAQARLAKQLAKVKHDAALSAARATYEAEVAMADAQLGLDTLPAQRELATAEAAAAAPKRAADSAASNTYEEAQRQAEAAFSAAMVELKGTLAPKITAALGKPAAIAKGEKL